jgi:hypothetical protein
VFENRLPSLGKAAGERNKPTSVWSAARRSPERRLGKTDRNRIEHERSRAMGGLRFFSTDDGFFSDSGWLF